MQLSEEEIKQIFFYCDEKLPDSLYADQVDIIQFAHKIVAYAIPQAVLQEHERCVKIVKDMNREVGNSLENQRPRL
jgi:hypothetical protein